MTRHRTLAHRLSDELYEPRKPIEPTHVTWRDVAEIVGGTIILGSLFVGILLVLFLVGG